MSTNIYKKYGLHMIIRVLTNLDRDPLSPTYGSFDRDYWNYKIRDFSSAILQQSCLPLALVYTYSFEGNIYFKNELIKNYAISAVKYWAKIQNKDGSFEEYWANERSIPATAFSLYAVCETCKILNFYDSTINEAIMRAARFLSKNEEKGALNQEMASVAALRNAAKVLDDLNLQRIADIKFSKLQKKQDKEGWYSEYGGADVGYLTVCLEFLTNYYQLSRDRKVIDSAKKIVSFLKYFVHPDGSIGGEYCTRNTEYFLPYGLEFMKQYNPSASVMIKRMMDYINKKEYLNCNIDERYILHYICASFIKSAIGYKPLESRDVLPCDTHFEKYFRNSMIYIKSNPSYYFICSAMKGGVFKVMDKKSMVMSTDTGYRLNYANKLYVMEWPFRNLAKIGNGFVQVESKFLRKKFFVQTPVKQTLLKIFSFFAGRLAVVISKNKLIYGKNKFKRNMMVKRQIILNKECIEVKDSISIGQRTAKLYSMAGLSMRQTASSKFFQLNNLNNRIKMHVFPINIKLKIKKRLVF